MALALLTACSDYPRDMGGTLDRIKASHEIKVGVIAGEVRPANQSKMQAFLEKLSAATGAQAKIQSGPAERLFARLDAGQVDLVVGELATDSPWATEVNILKPMETRTEASREMGFGAITRNGENGWTLLLEKTQRDMQAGS